MTDCAGAPAEDRGNLRRLPEGGVCMCLWVCVCVFFLKHCEHLHDQDQV